MPVLAWIALGGAIGATARHGVNVWSARLLGTEFPFHTLIVNVTGSLAIGVLAGLLGHRLQMSHELRALLIPGILGGFTTFSAFSLDVAMLVERKALLAAGLYAAGTMAMTLAAVFAGLYLARALLP
jgi:CrcB protein